MPSTLIVIVIGTTAALAGAIVAYALQRRGLIGKERNQKIADAEKKSSAESDLLRKYIGNFALVPFFRASSKKEAIKKLVEIAHERFPKIVCNADHAEESVFMREDSMPTGLDNGIAVPHGRTDGVNQITGVLALVDNSENENGVIPDYETMDHSKIQIIVLTLVPESAQAPYLHLMAYISQILRSEDNRQELMSCTTPETMRRFFRNAK